MLALVTTGNVVEIRSVYPRQKELEQRIIDIVRTQRGVKEDPDLWLMVASAMAVGANPPTPAIIFGTIYRMLKEGKIVGVDYSVHGCVNTFILAAGATVYMTTERTPDTVLRTVE